MRVMLAGLALLTLAPTQPVPAASDVRVSVTRDEKGWIVDYRFGGDSPAWIFARSELTRVSGKPWRLQAWTVETPGVRLQRRGFHDVLAAPRGAVPRSVRIRFRPFGEDLRAGYEPALVFTDGPVAIFTSQFDVAPLPSAKAAESLPFDFDRSGVAGDPAFITFRDPGAQVLHAGRRYPELTLKETPTYVLFGPAKPVETRDLSAILDPGLPRWIRDALGRETPRLLGHYAVRLGPRAGPKPMMMVNWAGPTKGLTSMGGSVLPGLVIMTFEGAGVLAPSKAGLDYARWFIAHEAAHFWLGQTVDYDSASHAWMMEGGADLLAVRALAAIDRDYDPRPKLDGAIGQCATLSKGRGVNAANQRGEHDAYYACGAVFGLVAEAQAEKARPGQGFAGFWRGLIDANRADGVVSQDEWLAALDRHARDPSLAADIRRLAERGSPNPRADIASLLRRAGVAHRIDEKGALRLR